MTKNLLAFTKLDTSKLTNKYVVIIDGKVIETGNDIQKLLKKARKEYPTKTPFVAKVPSSELLVL